MDDRLRMQEARQHQTVPISRYPASGRGRAAGSFRVCDKLTLDSAPRGVACVTAWADTGHKAEIPTHCRI